MSLRRHLARLRALCRDARAVLQPVTLVAVGDVFGDPREHPRFGPGAGRIAHLFGETGPEAILPLRRHNEREAAMAPVTLGTIVLVKLRDGGRPVTQNGSDEHPAMVTAVHGAGRQILVNAQVFVDGPGAPVWRTSIPHEEQAGEGYGGDTWRRPPRYRGEGR